MNNYEMPDDELNKFLNDSTWEPTDSTEIQQEQPITIAPPCHVEAKEQPDTTEELLTLPAVKVSSDKDVASTLIDSSVVIPIPPPTTPHKALVKEITEALTTKPAKSKPILDHNYIMLPRSGVEIYQEVLVKLLNKITTEYLEEADYYSIRKKYIAISMALNEKGLLAPAFRHQPRLPFMNVKRTLTETQLLVDQIVIDCHWLHCRKVFVKPDKVNLYELFDLNSKFDASAVSIKLGARVWKRDFRAIDMLALSDPMQHQLLILSSTNIHDKYKHIMKGYTKKAGLRVKPTIIPIRRAICAWAEERHQIRGQQEIYEALWIARELLGRSAKPGTLGKMAGIMIGVPPLDSKTVSGKYVSLDKMLARTVASAS